MESRIVHFTEAENSKNKTDIKKTYAFAIRRTFDGILESPEPAMEAGRRERDAERLCGKLFWGKNFDESRYADLVASRLACAWLLRAIKQGVDIRAARAALDGWLPGKNDGVGSDVPPLVLPGLQLSA